MKKKIIFCAFLLFGQNFLLKAQQKIAFKTVIKANRLVLGIHLFLAGNFNNWNPADSAWQLRPVGEGGFVLNKVMAKGVYQFKVTKGSWPSVECTADGKPADNRSLVVTKDTAISLNIAGWQDDFAIAEKSHTASRQVHIISDKFEMPQLGRQRRVWIYLPAGYSSSKKKYPVIYMHDGQNLFDDYTAGFGEWGIDEILDKIPDAKQSVIVGIDHGGDYRITEYDPFDSKYGKGRGDDYIRFIVQTLKPYIDKRYHVKTGAAYTTIAGSSMGGLISMYAALKYPGVFGNAGIFSPAFWIAPQIYTYAQHAKLPRSSRFYFVCGDAESDSVVTDMQKMAGIIRLKVKSNASAPVVIIKGASHNEKQWNGDFPGFYTWLTGSQEVRKIKRFL
ncbi:alpha/beta hydrolase-fold protein [Mucilaginibacter sp.]|uniref:alpha/beta hydrolase-fold protein n=1 Tax=Mucilaginibacter sp. TaxID=1882438 RepID=UPI00284A0DA8|nr:alpha/beta hydrolase-fold protein [Mucilaginibacter sp.]MDR3694835.1 alpha/beta hydrolase-fold protein [Mucilaginibacter sp.]